MQAPPEQHGWGLLGCPPDVLHRIWRAVGCEEDRHALRATCKGLRDVTATFQALTIRIAPAERPDEEDVLTYFASLLEAELRQFPPQSRMKRLFLDCRGIVSAGEVLEPVPHLLSTFILQAQQRLVHVTCLYLCGIGDLGFGDLTAVVDACPSLQQLLLERRNVVCGAAFTPLARLPSLTCLTLEDVCCLSGRPAALASLCGLTGLSCLTSLTIRHGNAGNDWDEDIDELRAEPPAGYLGDVALLPWLSSLHALKDLHLTILNAPDGPCAELGSAISNLRSLTRLVLEGIRLPPDCKLACAPKLVDIVALATVQAPDVRLYASLPSLQSVRLGRLNLEVDLSHLACTWTQLELRHLPSMQQLVRLPVGSGVIVSVFDYWGGQWQLIASAGLAVACTVVSRAAAWLGAIKEAHSFEEVELDWDDTPAFPCSQLLALLSPMKKHLYTLVLGRTWPLCAEDVRKGAQHLPEVDILRLEVSRDDAMAGAQELLQELGGRPWLQELKVSALASLSTQALDELRDAVKQLALQRARSGLSLRIKWHSHVELFQDADEDKSLHELVNQHSALGVRVTLNRGL